MPHLVIEVVCRTQSRKSNLLYRSGPSRRGNGGGPFYARGVECTDKQHECRWVVENVTNSLNGGSGYCPPCGILSLFVAGSAWVNLFGGAQCGYGWSPRGIRCRRKLTTGDWCHRTRVWGMEFSCSALSEGWCYFMAGYVLSQGEFCDKGRCLPYFLDQGMHWSDWLGPVCAQITNPMSIKVGHLQ